MKFWQKILIFILSLYDATLFYLLYLRAPTTSTILPPALLGQMVTITPTFTLNLSLSPSHPNSNLAPASHSANSSDSQETAPGEISPFSSAESTIQSIPTLAISLSPTANALPSPTPTTSWINPTPTGLFSSPTPTLSPTPTSSLTPTSSVTAHPSLTPTLTLTLILTLTPTPTPTVDFASAESVVAAIGQILIDPNRLSSLYDFFSEELKGTFSRADWEKSVGQNTQAAANFSLIGSAQVNNEWAQQEILLTRMDGQIQRYLMVLHLENGVYRLFGTQAL